MGCTHPEFCIRRVVSPEGKRGIRCTSCGSIAFEDDPWWRVFIDGTATFLGQRGDQRREYIDVIDQPQR